MTAYLLNKCADRLRVIFNGGRESTTPKQPGRQAGRQPGNQAGRHAASQAGRQAAQPAEGDLGQFLKLGKNPLC